MGERLGLMLMGVLLFTASEAVGRSGAKQLDANFPFGTVRN